MMSDEFSDRYKKQKTKILENGSHKWRQHNRLVDANLNIENNN